MQRMIPLNISLSPEVQSTFPQFKLGIIHYTKITISESPQMLKGRLQLFQEQLYFDLLDTPVSAMPGVQQWKEVGAYFQQQEPIASSYEQLLERIRVNNYLPSVQSAVDLTHFFSLQYTCPISLVHPATLTQPILVDADHQNWHSIALMSGNKPVTSPSKNAIQTAVTEDVTEAYQFFYLPFDLSVEAATQLLKAAGTMFTNLSGGSFTSSLLHAEQPELHL